MKIGFVGPFSTANLGDYAMLINNIYDLNCNDIVIFTYNPIFPQIALGEYCNTINIEYVEVKLKKIQSYKITLNKVYTPIDTLEMLDNSETINSIIEGIDTLVVSGGGWINHFWADRIEKLFKIMIPIYLAYQKLKNVVFTANGIGPFDNSRELYRYFFGYIKNATIAVRDQFCSKSHLLEVGVDNNLISELPDDLYILNQNIINRKQVNPINLENYIVIETFCPMELLKEYESLLINFSKKIYSQYQLSIVLLPFDLAGYGLEQAEYLSNILDNSVLYNIDDKGYLPIQDAYHIIKNAKIMITSRYHGLVLSLSAQTPVIFRLYDKQGDFE